MYWKFIIAIYMYSLPICWVPLFFRKFLDTWIGVHIPFDFNGIQSPCMETRSATSCKKIAILQGWVIGYCKYYTLSYEGLCLLNGLACTYNCPKTQVGQESSKSTCCLKNIANKAAKCALNAANTMEPNIVAKKRCGPKEAMKRTFMQGVFSLLVFSSSPDSLLQSHFFVSLGAPDGRCTEYQVQYKVCSYGFKRLRYVPLCIHRNQIKM